METQTKNTKNAFIIESPEGWNLFNSNAKEFLKFNVELEKLGFEKVVRDVAVNSNPSYEELTLVFNNQNRSFSTMNNLRYRTLLKTYPQLETDYCTLYNADSSNPNTLYLEVDGTKIYFGEYVPQKNIVYIQNCLYGCYNLDCFKFVTDILKANYERLKWKKVEIDRIQELCDKFLEGSRKTLNANNDIIVRRKSDIYNYFDYIKSYSKEVFSKELENLAIKSFINIQNPSSEFKKTIKLLEEDSEKKNAHIIKVKKDIEAYQKATSEAIKEIGDKFEEILKAEEGYNKNTFKQTMAELKNIPFVKNLRITNDGYIKYEIEGVKIKYGGKTYEMGDFTVIIDGERIFFEGSQYILVGNDSRREGGGERYFHPHIYEKQCCLGTFKPKMYDLLYKLKLADLALLIKQFLNTYTPNDKYKDLAFFTGANRYYKKFKNEDFGKDVGSYKVGWKSKDTEITTWREKESINDEVQYNQPHPSGQETSDDEVTQ